MDPAIVSSIITALVSITSGVGTLLGVILTNSKSKALMEYKINQLEAKVTKHNNLIDRMYKAEARLDVLEEIEHS